MIDYFMLFSSQVVAESDPVVSLYYNGGWDLSQTFPSISVVTAQAIVNSISTATGFWIMVCKPEPVQVLDTHPNLVMKLNRDLTSSSFVISSVITGSNRTNLVFHPSPQGSNYPQPLGQ